MQNEGLKECVKYKYINHCIVWDLSLLSGYYSNIDTNTIHPVQTLYESIQTRTFHHKISPDKISETGRIRFRRVRFQTPNSVSFLALTEFRGENSVSSSRPIICVPERTHRVLRRTHRVCRKTQWGSVSSPLRNSTLETVFRPFPKI